MCIQVACLSHLATSQESLFFYSSDFQRTNELVLEPAGQRMFGLPWKEELIKCITPCIDLWLSDYKTLLDARVQSYLSVTAAADMLNYIHIALVGCLLACASPLIVYCSTNNLTNLSVLKNPPTSYLLLHTATRNHGSRPAVRSIGFR